MAKKNNRTKSSKNRAVSTVISSVILSATVLILGFTTLYWAQYRSTSFNLEYSDQVNSSIDRLNEKIAFMNIYYNKSEGSLITYIISYGEINNLAISSVRISNEYWFQVFEEIQLKALNGTAVEKLDIQDQGYFEVEGLTLTASATYTIDIYSQRGGVFSTRFIA